MKRYPVFTYCSTCGGGGFNPKAISPEMGDYDRICDDCLQGHELLYWTYEEPTYEGWGHLIKDATVEDKSNWPKEIQ